MSSSGGSLPWSAPGISEDGRVQGSRQRWNSRPGRQNGLPTKDIARTSFAIQREPETSGEVKSEDKHGNGHSVTQSALVLTR